MTASVYSWLTTQGLWPSSLAALVYWLIPTSIATAWAFIKARHLYRELVGLWQRHIEAQEDQAKHLARVAYSLEQTEGKETP